jgi:polar amino acid transport system substrate-binding protein
MGMGYAFLKPAIMRIVLALGVLLTGTPLFAADTAITVPRFMDPRVRVERPDTSSLRVIRFLTDDEFPPLHFADPEGQPVGFAVDLARAACERLNIPCTMQVRRFETLLDSLAEGRGDALAAGIQVTPELRKRFAASMAYQRMPARFVAAKTGAKAPVSPSLLEGKRVAVVAGSAHNAYLTQFFPDVTRVETSTLSVALLRLAASEADYVFGDALTLALWLGGRPGANYAFAGGPYLESAYFGEGIGFLVRPEDQVLRRALDYALQQLWDDGTYARLYLRYFPISLY